jgi:uncharacterized protein
MKVLVTGAGGFVGKNICKKLDDLGHEVVVLSTNMAIAAINLTNKYKFYSWDIKKLPPKEAFEGIAGIIHLAGDNIAGGYWTNNKKKRIYDSRIDGTESICAGIKEYKPELKAFVSTSAIGIYGNHPTGEVTEECTDLGDDFLANVCKHWEAKVWEYTDCLPRTTIFRVGVVLGKGGGALKQMLPPFKAFAGAKLGSGKQIMSWIHMHDLVNLYVEALTNEKYSGVVNAVSPNSNTNKEFTKTLIKALGTFSLVPFVPSPIIELATGGMSVILLEGQKVVPTKAVANEFNYKFADLAPALKSLV